MFDAPNFTALWTEKSYVWLVLTVCEQFTLLEDMFYFSWPSASVQCPSLASTSLAPREYHDWAGSTNTDTLWAVAESPEPDSYITTEVLWDGSEQVA